MEAYFDAFVYLANWNTRQLMIRLPRRLLDIETAARYCTGESAGAWVSGEHVILDLTSEVEADFDEDGDGWLASIIPIRADMAAGDLRALYLGWLLCAQAGELPDSDAEPPVPANLARLTASLSSLVDFLHIDEDLLAVAAAGSGESETDHGSDTQLTRCIEDLSVAEKTALLLRAVRGDCAHLRAELVRRIRPDSNGAIALDQRACTVSELLNAADARRKERQRLAAVQKAKERARREREAVIAYGKRLDPLARREDAAWQQVNTLIEVRRPTEYDEAARLLKDLQALGMREGRPEAFDQRVRQLRERHQKKVSLLQRLDRQGL